MRRRLVRFVLGCLPRRLRNVLLTRRAVMVSRRSGLAEPPPSEYKQGVVRAYGKRYKLKSLIETGTYEGAMVEACADSFSKIVSIELDNRLARQAGKRFAESPNVEIIHGDSSQVLPAVLPGLSENCLFWLDAHYSGGISASAAKPSPVMEELEAILSDSHIGHVVLIDDARLFRGKNGWPTIQDIREKVRMTRPATEVSVEEDIIRILPAEDEIHEEETRD